MNIYKKEYSIPQKLSTGGKRYPLIRKRREKNKEKGLLFL